MPASRYIFGALPWYSVLIVSGICLAIFLAAKEEKRLGLPKDTVIDLALLLVPMGIVGARLYYVAFSWDMFRTDPISILYVWNGGLAIYGGIIGGLLAAVLFAWRRKLSMPTLFDMIVPGVALAQAIGRWGNFFNMEAYGAPVTSPAWQFFPAAVLIPGAEGSTWHMATFFYESMWNLGVFAVLWALRKRTHRRGDLFLWYLALYGAGRLVIEGLRMDSLYTVGGTGRVSQLLSVAMCLLTIGVFTWRTLRSAARNELLLGGTVGLCAIAACLLLPNPRDAFVLCNVVWALLAACAVGLPAALLLRRSLALKPLLCLPTSIACCLTAARVIIALSHADQGLATDTLVCIFLSTTALALCACLYPHTAKA